MRIRETTVPASPEFIAAVHASIAIARSLDPTELEQRIAEQNQPHKVRALHRRLAQYHVNRLAAEREYFQNR